MLKPINASWKIPIGYFPFKTLTGIEKKLISKALVLYDSYKVNVIAVTSDRLSSSISCMTALGCNFNP